MSQDHLTPEQEVPRVGDIWREVDPRFDRYIRVMRVGGRASIECVVFRGSGPRWERKPRTFPTSAALERFNGRRGGYKLHERGVLAEALP